MVKEFSKTDLQTGMLIKKNNNRIGIIINSDVVYSDGGADGLSTWNDDLTDNIIEDGSEDIIAVSKVLTGYNLCPEYWIKKNLDANLLWERSEEVVIDWSSNPLVKHDNGELTYYVRVTEDLDDDYFAGVVIEGVDFGEYADSFYKDSFELVEE